MYFIAISGVQKITEFFFIGRVVQASLQVRTFINILCFYSKEREKHLSKNESLRIQISLCSDPLFFK